MNRQEEPVRSESDAALRTRALESLLIEKGLLTAESIDKVVEKYENDVGPLNGARVVARAWSDPDYRRRLLENGTAAIAELGFGGKEGAEIVVLENTSSVHNVVVCTLCSCYPWPVLGLPPGWYKSYAYRSRLVREPRTVLGNSTCICRNRLKSASGTAIRIFVIWSCRNGLTARKASPRQSLSRWSRATR